MQRRDVAEVDPGDGERAAAVERPHRHRDELAGGSEQDRRIERLGRVVGGVAGRAGTEVEGEAAGFGGSRQHVHRGPFVEGHLGGEVRRGAEPIDAQAAARRQRGPTQRAVADDPGAQQRRRLGIVEHLGQGVGVALVDDRQLGVAAVGIPPGERRGDAQVLGAAPAEPAAPAGPAQPGDADALADVEAPTLRARAARRCRRSRARGRPVAAAARGRPRRGAGRCGRRRTRRPRRGSRRALAQDQPARRTPADLSAIGPVRSTHHARTSLPDPSVSGHPSPTRQACHHVTLGPARNTRMRGQLVLRLRRVARATIASEPG